MWKRLWFLYLQALFWPHKHSEPQNWFHSFILWAPDLRKTAETYLCSRVQKCQFLCLWTQTELFCETVCCGSFSLHFVIQRGVCLLSSESKKNPKTYCPKAFASIGSGFWCVGLSIQLQTEAECSCWGIRKLQRCWVRVQEVRVRQG